MRIDSVAVSATCRKRSAVAGLGAGQDLDRAAVAQAQLDRTLRARVALDQEHVLAALAVEGRAGVGDQRLAFCAVTT
jgi:hypothetical protein